MAGFMDISGTNLVIKSSNANENILCGASNTIILTKCQSTNGISVLNSIAYVSGMIGHTRTITHTSGAITISANSSTISSMTGNTSTSIPRGVYIIYIKVGLKVSTANNVHFISSGLSTGQSNYTSGTGIMTLLTESVLTTATNQNVYGMDCRPIDLSGNSYFFVINANATTSVETITSYCQCLCTRIA
jgi:hypothetical protein